MNRYICFLIFAFCVASGFAQGLPLKQSFEGAVSDSWSFTANPAAFNAGGDIWDRVSDGGVYFNPAPEGDYFWEFYDIDEIPGIAADGVCHLIFTAVDLSAQGECTLSFQYCNRGLDSTDYMAYSVAYDNDTVWNSANDVMLPKHSVDPAAWFTVQITIPADAPFCRLRLSAKANYSADCGGFDNIRLQEGCTLQPELTITSPADGTFYLNSVTNAAISGTAANIAGMILWSNRLNHLSGAMPATSAWSFAAIALEEGANPISVTATNANGWSAADSVELIRARSFSTAQLGAIAFTGFNTGSDSFSFVVLQELSAATVIRFTDEEWNGIAFGSGEDDLVWSNAAATAAGTVVEIYACDLAGTVSNNIGVIVSGKLALSQSGEGIIAYCGAAAREPSAFLAAISSVSENLNGTALIYGDTAVSIGKTPVSQYYSATRSALSEWRDYLPLVNNAASWSGTAGAVAPSGDPTPFTLKKRGCIFLLK